MDEVDKVLPSAVYCPTAEADTVPVYWNRWTFAEAEKEGVAVLVLLIDD